MTEGALRRYRGHISKTNESGNTKPHVLYKSESNEKNQKSNPRERKETAKAEREPFEAKNVIQFGCPIEREREKQTKENKSGRKTCEELIYVGTFRRKACPWSIE